MPPPPALAPPASPEIQAVLAAAQSLAATLAVARALVTAGRAVELDGLEAEAARLCVALACVAPGGAALLRPGLEEALRELERLDNALRLT